MKQRFTSAATSINSKKLPAIYKKLPAIAGGAPHFLMDYGCGRYVDHIRAALPETSVYMPYDVFNQPADVNAATVATVDSLRRSGIPVDVVCSNVLNVIAEDDVIMSIADHIRRVIGWGGMAYITVYEGDRTGAGRQTGPDQWQRNAPVRDYLRFFPGAKIVRGVIVWGGDTN